MSSIGDQILSAIVVALNVGVPAGLPQSELGRFEAVELTDAAPKRNLVYPSEDVPRGIDDDNASIDENVLTVQIESYALAGTSTTPAQEADRMYVWNKKTLADKTLGGLVIYLRYAGRTWQQSKEVDRKHVALVQKFRVRYQERATDAERST